MPVCWLKIKFCLAAFDPVDIVVAFAGPVWSYCFQSNLEPVLLKHFSGAQTLLLSAALLTHREGKTEGQSLRALSPKLWQELWQKSLPGNSLCRIRSNDLLILADSGTAASFTHSEYCHFYTETNRVDMTFAWVCTKQNVFLHVEKKIFRPRHTRSTAGPH